MSNLAVIEPTERAVDTRALSVRAGAKALALVPQTMEEAWRIANAVFVAQMAPAGMETAEKCLVAIMHGLEVGLTPMQALQRIAVINGRATIWGDAAIGLVRASGLLETISERVEGEGDNRKAIVVAKRRHDPNEIKGEFSVTDAKTAGLWNKGGPWKQYPDRMLKMRARSFCLRDGFSDVLGGLYLREEIDDEANSARDATPPVPPSPPIPPAPALAAPQAVPTPPEPPVPPAVPEPPVPTVGATSARTIDAEKIIAEFSDALDAAQGGSDVFEAWDDICSPFLNDLSTHEVAALERMRDEKVRRLD